MRSTEIFRSLSVTARRLSNSPALTTFPGWRCKPLTNLAFLASRGAVENPTDAFRDAITTAYNHRAWFDLWLCLSNLARWWTQLGQTQPAGVLVGFLIANGHQLAKASLNVIEAEPDHHTWLEHGASLDRDEFIDYILSQLD